jgi:hypothetical protein
MTTYEIFIQEEGFFGVVRASTVDEALDKAQKKMRERNITDRWYILDPETNEEFTVD